MYAYGITNYQIGQLVMVKIFCEECGGRWIPATVDAIEYIGGVKDVKVVAVSDEEKTDWELSARGYESIRPMTHWDLFMVTGKFGLKWFNEHGESFFYVEEVKNMVQTLERAIGYEGDRNPQNVPKFAQAAKLPEVVREIWWKIPDMAVDWFLSQPVKNKVSVKMIKENLAAEFR